MKSKIDGNKTGHGVKSNGTSATSAAYHGDGISTKSGPAPSQAVRLDGDGPSGAVDPWSNPRVRKGDSSW